ncbi:hypothetical protein HAX54_021707, partial [Datura stramonium]|nr:hypothetical protein [Datura stramonium]
MNAQEREVKRFQKLVNAQAKGNNQHAANNKNDDVDRNELNEKNEEDGYACRSSMMSKGTRLRS